MLPFAGTLGLSPSRRCTTSETSVWSLPLLTLGSSLFARFEVCGPEVWLEPPAPLVVVVVVVVVVVTVWPWSLTDVLFVFRLASLFVKLGVVAEL